PHCTQHPARLARRSVPGRLRQRGGVAARPLARGGPCAARALAAQGRDGDRHRVRSGRVGRARAGLSRRLSRSRAGQEPASRPTIAFRGSLPRRGLQEANIVNVLAAKAAPVPDKAPSMLTIVTFTWTCCFAAWTIFSIIGVRIQQDLGLSETEF